MSKRKEHINYKGIFPENLKKINLVTSVLGGVFFLALLAFAVAISVIGVSFLTELYEYKATAWIVLWEFVILLALALVFIYEFIYIKSTFTKEKKLSRTFASIYIGISLVLAVAAAVIFALIPSTEVGAVIKILCGALFAESAIRMVVMMMFSVSLDAKEKRRKR